MKFSDVEIEAEFTVGGLPWIKKSTRTALLCEFNRVFYFRQDERVTLEKSGIIQHAAKQALADIPTSEARIARMKKAINFCKNLT